MNHLRDELQAAEERRAVLARAALDVEGFRLGFDLFAAGREWDAHEVWEELWKERRGSDAGALLRGLIQWAAAGVKRRAERPKGARQLVDKALATWGDLPGRMVFDGLPPRAAPAPRSVAEGAAALAVTFDVDGARRALEAWRAGEPEVELPVPHLDLNS